MSGKLGSKVISSSLIFSTGVTNTGGIVTADVSTGVAGGQTIIGSTLTTEGLTIRANSADLITGKIEITTSTESSSTSTGCLVLSGGLGVAKKIYAGSLIDLPATTSADVGVISQDGDVFLHSYNDSLFLGLNCGNFSGTGAGNIGVGFTTLQSLTSGSNNVAIGFLTMYNCTTGILNTVVGGNAAGAQTTGNSCVIIGNTAAPAANVNQLVALGSKAAYSATTGVGTYIGHQAGYSNVTGTHNVFLGYRSGYYETGSNKLFIDNVRRTNEADSRIKSLVYGVFDAATANQSLTINGHATVRENLFLLTIKSGATQAAAGASASEVWKTASHATLPDNVLMIGV